MFTHTYPNNALLWLIISRKEFKLLFIDIDDNVILRTFSPLSGHSSERTEPHNRKNNHKNMNLLIVLRVILECSLLRLAVYRLAGKHSNYCERCLIMSI